MTILLVVVKILSLAVALTAGFTGNWAMSATFVGYAILMQQCLDKPNDR